MPSPALSRRSAVAFTAAACLALGGCTSDDAIPDGAPPSSTTVTPPPVHAGFDYQLQAPYDPPSGVSVVARDHTAEPARGHYNICYVNAFQAQPGAEREWDADLLLRDKAGAVVMDEDWGEAMLDLRTEAKRERIARTVNAWIDACAAKGYQAVEPDNYDSYARAPGGLLTARDAKAFLSLLARHAHEKGLAIAQKNTLELAPDHEEVGVDFAVVEECGQYDECGDYAAEFGRHMLVIEYTDRGLEKACQGWADEISIVRRDLELAPAGAKDHVRETCDGS